MEAALQIRVVSQRVDSMRGRQPLPLAGRQLYTDALGDRSCKVVLQRKDIA